MRTAQFDERSPLSNEQRALERQQRRIEDLCAASIRALSGQLELCLRAGRLYCGHRRLPRYAPHLSPDFGSDDATTIRGAADGLALRVSRSNERLHARLYPEDSVERFVFDLLEQFRVESLASPMLRGVRRNLAHRFRSWSEEFFASPLADTEIGLLLYTVAQICRVHVTGEPMSEHVGDRIEATRGSLVHAIGTDLRNLRRFRHDQAAYATAALSVAAKVAHLVHTAVTEWEETACTKATDTTQSFRLLLDVESGDDADISIASSSRSAVLDGNAGGYRVFTSEWDRETSVSERIRSALLAEYRFRLDTYVATCGINFNRLARDLSALLSRTHLEGWESGYEEGHIDGRRLAQLVASPAERRVFRVEQRTPRADCQVTFLIDCSGSMRQHAEPIAGLVDIFSRGLDMAGVPHEILAFTTGAWNGGRAQRDWLRAGQPRWPGRLNETLHLIVKPYERSWRQSRTQIAALLRPEIYREGVDGEAVDWACRRLLDRGHARRLLLVLSDGCPMDRATELANDEDYLGQHLCEVVAYREQQRHAEIYGIGVGLDLGVFYPRNLAIDLAAIRGNAALREILDLLVSGRAK